MTKKFYIVFASVLFLLNGCTRDVSGALQWQQSDDVFSSISSSVEEEGFANSSLTQSSEQDVLISNSNSSVLVSSSSVPSEVAPQSGKDDLMENNPTISHSVPITESSSTPKTEKYDLLLSFIDSNGWPIANEPVTCFFPDGSASVLGNTDELGMIHFSSSAIGVYGFELSEFDHSLRPQPLGLGLGPLYFEYSLTELTDTREASFTVEVYPIIEQSISDNCVVFYLYDQNNIPLAGKRIFYYVIPEGESCDDENTITEKLHLGLTDEEGKVVLHNPSVLGEYVFLYPHPNNRSISLEFSVVLESIENIQKFVLNAAEY